MAKHAYSLYQQPTPTSCYYFVRNIMETEICGLIIVFVCNEILTAYGQRFSLYTFC